MDEIDLSYAAGIVDGEGHVGICWNLCSTAQAGHVCRLLVQIGMTDSIVPKWLSATFGGHIHYYRPKVEGNRDTYTWALHSDKAAHFLELVLPYLKIKRSQAEICIQFQKYKRESTGRGRYRTLETIAVEDEAYERVKLLNSRRV